MLETELFVEESDDFYIGGELKTVVNLMPKERYQFFFNVIPLQIGRLAMPRFNVMEVESEKSTTLIKGYTKKCLIVK